MFNKMRRQDREISSNESVGILMSGNYGILSINGSEDYAYGIPLSYVYTENGIYFHCALEGEKLSRIRENNKVSFCVVGQATTLPEKFSVEYASTIVFGKINEVEGEEKTNALVAFIEKYSSDFKEKGLAYITNAQHTCLVLKINVDYISGKGRKR